MLIGECWMVDRLFENYHPVNSRRRRADWRPGSRSMVNRRLQAKSRFHMRAAEKRFGNNLCTAPRQLVASGFSKSANVEVLHCVIDLRHLFFGLDRKST